MINAIFVREDVYEKKNWIIRRMEDRMISVEARIRAQFTALD